MTTPKVRSRADSGKASGDGTHELRNYRLYERVGQEELATVYRAAHLTLDRPVRVHILRRTDWVSSSRFQLAGRLSARLSHPNLLPVIDAGHDDHLGNYLVTPQVEARPLGEVLAAGPLDPLLALRIATQMATVLDYLHQQQVVHRDVQPANILLAPQGLAYLTNLGLASSPDTPDLSSVDEADYLTPYSAPEQRLDQSANSPTLDVYGLGAVLYHMLSGEVPPAPGSDLSAVASRDPALSGIDRVLRRMMAVDPAARFPTPGAAISALRQAMRTQIDLATEDMEESRWETSAEWLENPLETVLANNLEQEFKEFLTRSRRRADELHRRDAIRRLLNRWSRGGFFRRPALGQLIQPEQIVSYNIYFYDLRTQYETRTAPQSRQRAAHADDRSAVQLPPTVWDVEVPEAPPFAEVKPQELVLPSTTRVFTCPECRGAAQVVCPTCHGKNVVERTRKVRNPDNSMTTETFTEECPTCRGYGKQKCARCEGQGNLVEEQIFSWSRRARLWQNTDDLEGLPVLALRKRATPVYSAPINPYDGHWHSVAPLGELLRAAIAGLDDNTRLIGADLSIKGAPVTEMDVQLNEKQRRLYFVGFDNELVGDWSLLNPERIGLAAAAVILVLMVMLFLVLR